MLFVSWLMNYLRKVKHYLWNFGYQPTIKMIRGRSRGRRRGSSRVGSRHAYRAALAGGMLSPPAAVERLMVRKNVMHFMKTQTLVSSKQ